MATAAAPPKAMRISPLGRVEGDLDLRVEITDGVVTNQGRIANHQVITPTAWNIGPRDARDVPGPMERAFLGAPIRNPADPVEMGHVARSYDCCLVCTVHAYDGKTGRELAAFHRGAGG